jgi:Cu-Zn family superoxide dismutase
LSILQAGANLTLTVNLSGFNASGPAEHGFHVHQNGAISNQCTDAGPHLNFDNTSHGAPNDTASNR